MEELTLDDRSFEPDYEYPYEHEDDGNSFSLPSTRYTKLKNLTMYLETDLATRHAGMLLAQYWPRAL